MQRLPTLHQHESVLSLVPDRTIQSKRRVPGSRKVVGSFRGDLTISDINIKFYIYLENTRGNLKSKDQYLGRIFMLSRQHQRNSGGGTSDSTKGSGVYYLLLFTYLGIYSSSWKKVLHRYGGSLYTCGLQTQVTGSPDTVRTQFQLGSEVWKTQTLRFNHPYISVCIGVPGRIAVGFLL